MTQLPGQPDDPTTPILSRPRLIEPDAPVYSPPVDALLRLGTTSILHDPKGWPDYVATYGLSTEDVPQLIRMMRDWRRDWTEVDPETEEVYPEGYSAVHAWRALGQLKAAEAARPLLDTLDEMIREEDEDFSLEEVPSALGLLGAAALEPLQSFLRESGHEHYAISGAVAAVQKAAQTDPTIRLPAVEILMDVLDKHQDASAEFNGHLISSLLDLQAVEAMPSIRRTFSANRVDGTICGNFEDVRNELKVAPSSEDPPPRSLDSYWEEFHPGMASSRRILQNLLRRPAELLSFGPSRPPTRSVENAKRKSKDKRKAAKKAKRQNRKR